MILTIVMFSNSAISGVQCLQKCAQDVYTSTNKTLNEQENSNGFSWSSPTTDLPASLIRHTEGPNYNVVAYTSAIVDKDGLFSYVKYNDYLQLAMSTSFDCGSYYVPYSTPSLNDDCSVGYFEEGSEIWKGKSKFTVRIRITKPMINGVYPVDTLLAKYWMSANDGGRDALLANYHFSGTIIVPQQCVLQPGTVYEIDLGQISQKEFVEGGKGNRPKGFVSRPLKIGVKCQGGVNESANLTVRLTGNADSEYKDTLKTDNKDISIVVTKDDGQTRLKPNDINSIIPFDLKNGYGEVTIKSFPISTTGLPPAAEAFSTHAVLRFDFQ